MVRPGPSGIRSRPETGVCMYKNVLEYLEKTAAGAAADRGVSDVDTFMTYPAFVEMARNAGAAMTGLVPAGRPVAVFAEKGVRTLAAMIGVVYSGGFYVSINPEQPAERIARILRVLDPALVIVSEEMKETLLAAGFAGQILDLDATVEHQGTEEEFAALDRVREQSGRDDILYGVFTSGSTGDPKGIIISHGAVIDFIGHFTEIFEIGEKDIIGNQAPFDFDVSVKDIYSSFFTGAGLVLIPRTYFSTPPVLLDYICDRHVTVLIWAVSALCIVSGLKIPDQLRIVMFSGEVMPVRHLTMWQKALPEAEFVNLYGPSEITCNSNYYRIDRIFEKTEKIPIGEAFPGREVFLLDESLQPVTETGKSGEICVAGESLGSGYYHNPEQTAKHFIMYPAAGPDSRPIYRTGDVAYRGEDGQLYFAGRADFQIKHMGHRIELEEIETHLGNVEGVSRAVCIYDQNKSRIYAFYTGDTDSKTIRTVLKSRIPVYMVPNKFVKLDTMPLNKNGKIDRAALRKEQGIS